MAFRSKIWVWILNNFLFSIFTKICVNFSYYYDVRSNPIIFVLVSIISRIHFICFAYFCWLLEPFLFMRFFWIGKSFDVVKIKIKMLDNHWKSMQESDDEKYEKLVEIIELFDKGLRYIRSINYWRTLYFAPSILVLWQILIPSLNSSCCRNFFSFR